MLVADAFDGDVAADPALGPCAHDLAGIVAARIDGDDVADDILRESEARVVDVGEEQPCRAGCARGEQGENADRPGARDQDAAAGPDAAAVAGIDRDSGRLDQRRLGIGHRIRDLHEIVVVEQAVLGHAPALPAEAGQREKRAQVEKTAIGEIVAGARHDQRLHGNPVAGPQGADTLAHRLDHAAEFMAEDLRAAHPGEGVRLGGDEDRPIGIFVQVGAANADKAVADQDLARPGGGWPGDLFDAQVLGRVEAERFHDVLSSIWVAGAGGRRPQATSGREVRTVARTGRGQTSTMPPSTTKDWPVT